MSFWFTRVQANKSAISALLFNRVGDMFLTIGLFALIFAAGNVDYAVIFSIAPVLNETIISVIGICFLIGAMAKSAQIGLHVWLPQAMEGPTPVSALIHAATMVISSCRLMMEIILLLFRLTREELSNKFIYALLLLLLLLLLYNICEINKKILRLGFLKKSNKVNLRYFLNLISEYKETESETTLNFNNYISNYSPSQKKPNQKFLEWFVGFTEGDGSFVISKNKVYFDITQSISDCQVLYKIKKELGFGKILFRREAKRNVAVFYVTSKENFKRLVHIFNGNLVSSYKKNKFENWLEIYNLQYKENISFLNLKRKPSLDTKWLTGFIDAEGCFTGRVKSCHTSRLKKAVHLALTISQKEKEIISNIRDLFINKDKCLSYDKSLDGWRVSFASFSKLEEISNYLLLNPLITEKRIAFIKLKKILNKIKLKKHLTESGLLEIEKSIKFINSKK